ncbi:MAG: hypothetical protein V1807_01630 [Patescibacteria group bacterium]
MGKHQEQKHQSDDPPLQVGQYYAPEEGATTEHPRVRKILKVILVPLPSKEKQHNIRKRIVYCYPNQNKRTKLAFICTNSAFLRTTPFLAVAPVKH